MLQFQNVLIIMMFIVISCDNPFSNINTRKTKIVEKESSVKSKKKIVTQYIEYQHGDKTLEGYLVAYESTSKLKRPGILAVHEWKGLGEDIKKRVQKLAGLDYVVFAIDMYGSTTM